MHLTLWLMCCEFILGNFLRNHFYLQNHRGCKIPHPNDFESEELLKLKLRFFFSIAFDFKTLWVIIFSSITVMILQSKRKCKRWKLEEKLLTVIILLHMFLKAFNELLFSPPPTHARVTYLQCGTHRGRSQWEQWFGLLPN